MKQLIVFFLILVLPNVILSQENQSKKDLIRVATERERNHFEKVLNRKDTSNLTFFFNKSINIFVDSLQKQRIDTIGVYYIYYHDGERFDNDKCMCGKSWIGYVNWKEKGKINHVKLTQCCSAQKRVIDYSTILGYYQSYSNELKNEYILPVTTEMTIDENGKIKTWKGLVVNGYNYCSLYCKFGEETYMRAIDLSKIASEGMFRNENINSRQYSWIKLIESQMKEIETK